MVENGAEQSEAAAEKAKAPADSNGSSEVSRLLCCHNTWQPLL